MYKYFRCLCVTFAVVLLAKASHMIKPRISAGREHPQAWICRTVNKWGVILGTAAPGVACRRHGLFSAYMGMCRVSMGQRSRKVGVGEVLWRQESIMEFDTCGIKFHTHLLAM